jgi:hypothetical protein
MGGVNGWALLLIFGAIWFLFLGLVWAIVTVGGRADVELELQEKDAADHGRPLGNVNPLGPR